MNPVKGRGQRAKGRGKVKGKKEKKDDNRKLVPDLCPLPSALCPPFYRSNDSDLADSDSLIRNRPGSAQNVRRISSSVQAPP